MKIICTKSNLVKGVNIVSKAVPSKTTMPILECILIDASTNIIKFTANDMELGIETVIDGTILEKGIVAIDAKIFSEIVRKLPDNEVVIECDSNLQTTISCEKAKFSISAKSGEGCEELLHTIEQILETQNTIFAIFVEHRMNDVIRHISSRIHFK